MATAAIAVAAATSPASRSFLWVRLTIPPTLDGAGSAGAWQAINCRRTIKKTKYIRNSTVTGTRRWSAGSGRAAGAAGYGRPGRQNRARTISSIVSQLRLYVAHVQHIGESFAARNPLGHADLHALLLVMEADLADRPLTPGDPRAELNLSSGSVTGVVDRLETAGHVYRDRDTVDRRKTFLRYAEPGYGLADRQLRSPENHRAD
ncbi:MarR family winged helix-turn-helix transcriptional regulator [Plantactinospora sp. WMMB334]|uniref:MarR family winged helix-turn-helix transcriptional regulator n=1 Tax=Plantactinospora sp. WMMB334 TaxID=3404119 RepID=UPI003B94A4BC